jgi:hypothetical protein
MVRLSAEAAHLDRFAPLTRLLVSCLRQVRAEASLALLLFNHSLRIQPRDKAQKEGEVDDSKNLVGRINSLMYDDSAGSSFLPARAN